MKNKISTYVFLSFFMFYYNCEIKKDVNIKSGLTEIDSNFTIDSIELTRRISKYNDSTFCIREFTESQTISIDIKNNHLFEQFRDSIGLQSNRVIGLQIFGFRCAGCHDFKDNRLIELSKKTNDLNLVLSNGNHKNKLIDTLSSNNIRFIKDYLDSL
jgi:hypothetical protein